MIKDSLSDLQKKVGEILSFLPIHPNHITILSVVFAAFGAYFIFDKNWIGMLFILLAFAFDGLDGAIARAKKLSSKFGAYMDGICDRVVEFFVLLPFILDSNYVLPSALILFFGTCMTSFSKAYADHREVCDAKTAAKLRTLLPRTERVIAIFIALALYLNGNAEVNYLLWAISIASIIAFINLQLEAYYKAKKNEQDD